MRFLLLFIVIFPLNVFAVDNMMVNEDIMEIQFEKSPTIGMSFEPGNEPGAVISLPEGAGAVISGYRVQCKGIKFIIGISCDSNLSDDCSTYLYSDDYKNRTVYIRYLQTSDRQFKTPEGVAVGDRWGKTVQNIGDEKLVYSGNDSCVQLKSGWNACIDLMSAKRTFDVKARRLFPKSTEPIDFFYKSSNK
jgi:hypothetical protein